MQFITEEERRRKHIEVDKIMTEKDFFDDMKRIEEEVRNGKFYTEEQFNAMMENKKAFENNLF